MKNNLSKNSTNISQSKINWDEVQSRMKTSFGNDIYESWLRKLNFVEEFKNYILLSVSTRFIRDWITSRYLDQILKIIRELNKNITRIELKIQEINDDKPDELDNSSNKKENISFIKDSFLQYNRIDQNKTFDNFVIGQSNKLAFEASKKVTQSLAHYNPLVCLWGCRDG